MRKIKVTDPILMEVINNNLLSIADQTGITLIKCAFSPNIKERRDCSTALLDAKGRVVAQAAYIPGHLGNMLDVGKEILKKYGKNIHEGDTFINNDPYLGGSSHLSDWTVTTPIFHENKLMFFSSNTAHHVDVGGRVPGSTSPDNKSIFEEGIRIPLVKIVEKGKPNEEIIDLITWNCRDPQERKLDLNGQIAANIVGKKNCIELCKKYGNKSLESSIEMILNYTENKIRGKINELPDGDYEFINYLDDDGIEKDEMVPIKAKVTIKGSNIKFDFTGSGKQARGALNSVRCGTLSAVYYVMMSMIAPDILPNDGLFRVPEVYAPIGTILNPRPGAAVSTRLDTKQRLSGVLIGALNQALPLERRIAGSNSTGSCFIFYGYDQKREKDYTYVESIGGGSGARFSKDGLDGVQVHITNTSNQPVESVESEYPLIIENYSFINDSCGSGKFRGGLGIRRDIRPIYEFGLTTRVEGTKTKPWGINGGKEGSPSKIILNPGPNETNLPPKQGDIRLKAGNIVSLRTPGAGGFGDPLERDRKLIIKDIEEEKITVLKAKNDYNFIKK